MRNLTKAELVEETLHRLALRGIQGKMSSEIVRLVADMIELSKEPVPECYAQATGSEDEWPKEWG